jgi:hypothetical protein
MVVNGLSMYYKKIYLYFLVILILTYLIPEEIDMIHVDVQNDDLTQLEIN